MGKSFYTRNERLAIIIVGGVAAVAIGMMAILDMGKQKTVVIKEVVKSEVKLDGQADKDIEGSRRKRSKKKVSEGKRAKKESAKQKSGKKGFDKKDKKNKQGLRPTTRARDYLIRPEDE